ncbi:MAG: hypothetical protein JXA64_00465 [Candidatus Fermentibacteraceae bacterium]|nr:hypothetical protein [Candidatus Fermentibacteraceae bacterium]
MLIPLLLVAVQSGAEGELRTRLQRRLPDPRGILEDYYTGDGWDFYSRLMFSTGFLGFTFMTDKSSGEDWGDLLAGGAIWTPGRGPVTSVSAGYLRADLGSGLVLAAPGSFSDMSELAMYKPPVSRNRIDPAASPWGCRDEPLTGAGVTLSPGEFDISVLAALSPLDSLSGGYHRTPPEVSGRGAFAERLAAVRISRGGIGLTAVGSSRSVGGDYGWFRAGADWTADLGDLCTSGEVALGKDSAGTTAAGWTALSMQTRNFRNMVMVLRNPADFPDERASAPVSRQCDLGVCIGVRWRVLPATVLKSGAGIYFTDEEDLLLASAELEHRFPWSMEGSLGLRTRTETDTFGWRGWLGTVWKPHYLISVSTKVQLSGWRDSAQDSTESGAGLEMKLRYSPADRVTMDFGGAACSTDGYNSRVYAGGSSFPGVFGSTALYDRTILLFTQLSFSLTEDIVLRGAVSHRVVEEADELGSGWEETEGGSRTELGFQLDYAFR